MKVICFTVAILSLSLSISVFAMGMGEIKVHSFLNQPFNAEIPITDTNGVSVDSIRVNLASVEEYSRIGLTTNEMLSFLKFSITNDSNGQPVIAITSTERIPEPFLQIVVDLAWPAGQIYRAYTILLDPPGYQIKKPKSIMAIKKVNINKTSIGEPGVIDQPVYQHINSNVTSAKEATYGPTLANETIWQIAQRYKTTETTLPQVVLAIVGANQGAFTQGNLNGLKAGERLKIPPSEHIAQIPIQLASGEVAAHDVAWQNKEEIKHIISPPYSSAASKIPPLKERDMTYYESKIAPIPKFNLEAPAFSNTVSSLPAPEVFFSPSHTMASLNAGQSKNLKAQSKDVAISAGLGLTLAAIDTVRTENSIIKEQLEKLKAANNRLEQQVSKQQKEMALLQEQLKVIIKERQALHAQVTTLPASQNSSWLYWLIVGGSTIVLGYGLLYWFWIKQREDEDFDETRDIPSAVTDPSLNNTAVFVDHEDNASNKTTGSEFTKQPVSTEPLAVQAMQVPSSVVPNQDADIGQTTKADDENNNEVKNSKIEPLDTHQTDLSIKQQDSQFESISSSPMNIDTGDNINKQQAITDNISENQPPILAEPTPTIGPISSVSIEEVNDKMKEDESKGSHLTENVTLNAENDIEQEDNYSLDELEPEPESDNITSSGKLVKDFDQPADFRKQFKHKQQEDYTVDFEPGLDKLIKPKPKQIISDEQSVDFIIDEQVENLLNGIKQNPDTTSQNSQTSASPGVDTSINTNNASDESLSDFATDMFDNKPIDKTDKAESSVNSNEAVTTENELPEDQLVKSQAALDTLLSLAETYIAMEDFDAASQSLEEVMKFGNDTQKAQAEKLLQKLTK